ncbi:DUF4135 domain-containing protein [Paraliomyxa miuraensis]|uniref:DUF4135 domain-containing protein n=1 Tax=Paraliomyxa miuraensis TaxID=376150 RepID=UPI002259B6E9|nr:DUF4135 domain-containing protein [Paraliomyxa miuraensis]MCX4241317.1 DUF4135 domain-containing protein [Paraliomyxa miuraensis]
MPAIPFGDAFEPFVHDARRGLELRAGHVQPAAVGGDLRRRLSSLGSRCLLVELALGSAGSLEEPSPDSSARHDALIAWLCDGGWSDVLGRVPGLEPLIHRSVHDWEQAMVELWQHVERSASAASSVGPRADEHVVGVKAPRHGWRAHARLVRFIELSSGRRVVHRPRGLVLDRGFARLLHWIGERADVPEPRAASVHDEGDHGWQAWVPHRPCHGADELRRYHRRTGVLLGAAWLLGATDLHAGNLVADGEHPVLVDLETLLHPRAAEETGPDDVRRTGLLPHDGLGADAAGLTARPGVLTGRPGLEWVHVGTDAIDLRRAPGISPRYHNLPVLDGTPVGAVQHVDAVVHGLVEALEAVMGEREALLSCSGPIAELAEAQTAFVLRPGDLYQVLIQHSLHPRALVDPEQRRRELHELHAASLAGSSFGALQRVVDAELAALERAEAPELRARASERGVILSDGSTIQDCFPSSAWQACVQRIMTLDRSTIAAQAEVTRRCLSSVSAGGERLR